MSHMKDIDNKNKYLDDVASFLILHVPDYVTLPDDCLHALEHVWLAIADHRIEFISILNNLRKTRKKRVAPES